MLNQDLIEQFFNIMVQLRKLALQKTNESHEEKAATMLQFTALNFLKGQDGMTVTDLAQSMHLSKSSTTQLTDRLVKMKLIKRLSDKSDRRIVKLVLTEKGEAYLESQKHEIIDKMRKILSKLPEKDLTELIRISTNLTTILEQENI